MPRAIHRILISAILFSAVLLAMVSNVDSQTYTTITSISTVTSRVTSTQYSTYVVGTTTATSTVTDTPIYQRTFTVQGVSPGYCYGYTFHYNATAGDRLQGQWSSNYVLNFYLMSQSNYDQLNSPSATCGGAHPAYDTATNVASYSFDWVVPTSGIVHFVFYNFASQADTSQDRTVTFTLYRVGPHSAMSQVYSTVSTAVVYQVTQALTSVSVSQVSPLSSGGDLLYIALAAIAVVLIVVVFVMALRRRKPSTAEAYRPTTLERRMVKEPEAAVFCINCGAQLKPNSKFCNKCGSAQS